MKQYIDKSALVAEIEKKLQDLIACKKDAFYSEERVTLRSKINMCKEVLSSLNTLEVIDPYEQCIQYASIKDGIKAHAETYSFNIESELFNQLTKEQQMLWRKEIEQACISGGDMGYSLAKDPRYKENLEEKEVDFEKELDKKWNKCQPIDEGMGLEIASIEHEQFDNIAKHFFELGLNVNNPFTWEDVSAIRQIIAEYRREENHEQNNEGFCKEVLKRFEAQK